RQAAPTTDAMPDPYDGALAYVDQQIGRLLEGLAGSRPGRERLVVVVGDHGESLGEHDEVSHGILAYDATLHVPLVVAGPGFPAGRRSDALARPVDVAPTLLAAARAVPRPGSNGRS